MAAWQADTAYSVGDKVDASSPNPIFEYVCLNAGTSGLVEPAWNNTPDGLTVDPSDFGDVLWLSVPHTLDEGSQIILAYQGRVRPRAMSIRKKGIGL